MTLQGCSERVITEINNTYHYTPDDLMFYPCDVNNPEDSDGDITMRSLSVAYVKNNTCIRKYKGLIDAQKEWKKRMKEDVGAKDTVID